MEPEIQAADCTGADGVIQVISAVPNRQQNIRSLNAQQMITLPTTAQDDSGAPQDDTTYQEGTETLVYDMELNRYIKQRVDLLPSSTGTSKRGVETTNTQSQEDGQSKRRCFIGGRSISNSAYTDKKSNYTKNYLRSQTFKGENEDFTIEPLAPNIWKCDSPQNVLKCVDTHEKKQITQFVRRRLPDSQPKIEDLKSKRITWTLNDRHYVQKVIFRIPFNGMPSIVMQSVVRFYCRHGADMSTSAKRRYIPILYDTWRAYPRCIHSAQRPLCCIGFSAIDICNQFIIKSLDVQENPTSTTYLAMYRLITQGFKYCAILLEALCIVYIH